jgi:hypothetical protein
MPANVETQPCPSTSGSIRQQSYKENSPTFPSCAQKAVVLPRRVAASSRRPDQQAAAFQALLARKSRWLSCAVYAFSLGVASLAAALVMALLEAQ